MSQNELHKGYFKPLDIGEATIEETCEYLAKKKGIYKELELFKDIAELINYEHEDYYIRNGKIFQVFNQDMGDESYVNHTDLKDSGEVEYVFMFYNGGTCLSEHLEEAIDKHYPNT